MSIKTVLIGARGYVGAELISILSRHSKLDLIAASSRELDGQRVSQYIKSELYYQNLSPKEVIALSPDLVILALPNGLAQSFVDLIDDESISTTIIDLSADHRFDPQWHYGLPEVYSHKITKRISNPGCYATAVQLCVAPVQDLVDGRVSCFGISGYSGAGTAPSDKNNLKLLQDNIMPYSLANHLHEQEVTHHLGLDIKFSPHVAQFFRGICLTAHIPLKKQVSLDDVTPDLEARYSKFYKDSEFIQFQVNPPQISQVTNEYGAVLGGLALSEDGSHLALTCTLDNLLKGAASQAVQNINLVFELPQLEGLSTQ
ncbi:N-acetyl-gamma-glutamyl-phosphate reductase [Kangiella japonica]|uniref:N-acetyl-gamma-glutamyl-phosphate reductase n=1 Tax=Kangiella japonica TaxID=647384 RepID=A0ABP3CEW5_9GAMM